MSFLNNLFYKINKNAIDRAIIKLKKIPIDVVMENITKNCWKYGIQLEVIIKNKNELVVKLSGRKQVFLLKFQKAVMVFTEEYNEFVNTANILNVNKAIYITTGVFQQEIYKLNHLMIFSAKVLLQDNYKFIKKQIWINKKFNYNLKYKNIEFYRYLPL